MASVLFIYPPVSLEGKNPSSGFTPPLGALYLGTILKNNGHEVHVIDANAEQLSLAQIKRRVESIDPDVIGLTCLTFNLDASKAMISEIRKTADAYIAVGGPHLSAAPEASFGQLGADAYIIGEGESIINELVDKKPRGIIHAPEVQDLDSIPFPDRSLVEHIDYGTAFGLSMLGGKATSILTTRGCKYACAFCNRPKKASFRSRSPKNILLELKEIDRMGFKAVEIVDDNFTNNPKNVIKLARLMKREKLKFNFIAEGRVDATSEALYKSMRDMGVVGLSHGVESLNPKIVRWYNKTRYPEKWPEYVKKTLKLCDRYGLVALESLIFGAPMETKEDMEHSIDFLEKNGADLINGNILMYLVGSAIWRWGRRTGKIGPDRYLASAPELGLTPYSREELQEMCDRCTDFMKREGWKGVTRKVLDNRRFDMIYYGIKTYITHYWRVRKARKEMYEHGYGKSYMGGKSNTQFEKS